MKMSREVLKINVETNLKEMERILNDRHEMQIDEKTFDERHERILRFIFITLQFFQKRINLLGDLYDKDI